MDTIDYGYYLERVQESEAKGTFRSLVMAVSAGAEAVRIANFLRSRGYGVKLGSCYAYNQLLEVTFKQ